jgi:hypothetical protein
MVSPFDEYVGGEGTAGVDYGAASDEYLHESTLLSLRSDDVG